MNGNDWKPVRNGLIYCSPSCGGKCTHAAYLAAKRKANALARKLGYGWQARVWENLGWHWSVRKGTAEVHKHGNAYSLLWDIEGKQIVAEGATAWAAISLGKVRATLLAKRLQAAVKRLNS